MVFTFRRKSQRKIVLDESFSRSSTSSSRSSSFDQQISPIHPDAISTKHTNVLLVGQIYMDTIMTVEYYPQEDSKIQSGHTHQRRGGNCLNTAEVLSQFSKVNVSVMSAIGSKESSSALISQLEARNIKTSTCVHRKAPTPSCYIIQCKDTGSRTIISCNNTQEITREEFSRKIEMSSITKAMSFDSDATPPFTWVHFEGRNIYETAAQIDWLESKATREGWRSQLTISIELEKPDRPHIDVLLTRGDIVFFSKLYAQKRGYDDAEEFLRDVQGKCKPGAVLFCTWGEKGASCFFRGEVYHASALHQNHVVDTVGAGDTFVAGVIHCMSRGHHILTALKFSCEMASRKVAQVGFDGLADLMAKVWENTLCSELTKTAQEHKIMLHSKSYENGFLSYGFGTLRSKNIATVRSQISHSSSVPLIKQ